MQDYSKKRFLVVDDFSDFRTSVKSMLRDMRATDVDTADCGEDTLKCCRKNRYDIILHDYNLGAGKNGQQVLEELLAGKLISHQCIFVMVTAESAQAMVLSALEYEPDAYLTKPFNKASLIQRLDKLVERKTALKPILLALDKQDYAGVLAACLSLSQQDPRYAPLCVRYQAGALRELGRQDELQALLTTVLAERQVPWACMAFGALLQARGQLPQAREVYENALQTFPMLPGLYDGLAAVLVGLGEGKRAQSMLEEAVKLSPMAIRRQMQLGKLALDNQDFTGATRAYRKAVEQGRTSSFQSAENYLGLSQALTAQAGDGPLEKRVQADINQTIGELQKNYSNDPAVQVRSRLVHAQSLLKSGDPAQADKLTAEAMTRLDALAQFFPADTALQIASQLRELGQPSAGDALLKTCVEIYGDDPLVMQGIAKQTDDPSILGGAKDAQELNRQGVRCYQQGQYDEALALFRRALLLQPKNISSALNTAQSLLRVGGSQAEAALLEECRNCLNAVQMMPSTDPRFERYQKLREKAFGG
jgi:CheY-like chemotaxis protein/cytochrome c-type biogenesis protein CcmH/NrfG